MKFNFLHQVRDSDCGEVQCIAVRRYRQGLKIHVVPYDHEMCDEPHKPHGLKAAFSASVLSSSPSELESCGQSAPMNISFGHSNKDCNPTIKQCNGDTVEHNVQGTRQDAQWPFNLTRYDSAPRTDDRTNKHWTRPVGAEDLRTVPTYLKPDVRACNEAPIVDTVANNNDSLHGESSIFDKNWSTLNEGEIGCGSFGSVCRAVRKSSSRHYKASEKGKIYAIKRTHSEALDVQELHSLRHERLLHSVAKLDASWKTIRLFAFMVECEANVQFPTWAAYQYCEGRTLHSIENRFSGFVPAGLIIDILDDISTALTWLHSEIGYKPRMAHCDFHSGNVMLDLSRPVPYGRHPYICIVDFGMAEYVPRIGSDMQQAMMTVDQNTDINDFGHLIHGLVHKDHRYCGRGEHTQHDQVTHCYQKPWLSQAGTYFPPCPGLVDPNTALFLPNDREFWWLMMQGCFRPINRNICNISWTMADIRRYLQGYIARARQYLWSLPTQSAMYDNTISILQGMKRAPPMLAVEHLPTPPLPPPQPSAADIPLPPSSPRISGNHVHLHPQYTHAAYPGELSPLPDYEYYEAQESSLQQGNSVNLWPEVAATRTPDDQNAAISCHQGAQPRLGGSRDKAAGSSKRKQAELGMDQDFGIDEPFAKRLRAHLAKEIASLDALAQLRNSHDPTA